MTSMADAVNPDVFKGLILGESGVGKTGALAALVDAGLNVRILDFDGGVEPIAGRVKDKTKLKNVHFVPLRDTLELTGSKFTIKKADAFARAMKLLMSGGDLWGVGSNIPKIYDWTSNDVLVVDTLAMMGRSALLMTMEANGAAMKTPELQHYGIAMEQIEKFIGQMTSDAVKCHLIVNTHISYSEKTNKITPESLGDKLGPKLPRYFNNMLSLSLSASGKRVFKTKTDGLLALKTSKPIAETYPIETGLVDIIKDLTGKTNLVS